MNGLKPGKILFCHFFRERPLGGPQLCLQPDCPLVSRKRVKEPGFRFVSRCLWRYKAKAQKG